MSAHPIRKAARPAADAQSHELLTDTSNARRMVAVAGDSIRFVPTAKKWITRDEQTNLWSFDGDGGIVRHAQRAARTWFDDAHSTSDLSEQKNISAHAIKSQNRAKLHDAIELAKAEPGITIAANALDADPWLLSVRNGVVDLKTGDLRSRRSDDLMTKCAAASYDSDAECPRWEAFLLEAMDDRWELVDFLQLLLGYALLGANPEQAIAIFVGTHANGKSTLLTVVQEILSGYAMTTPAATFMERPEGAASNDLARLLGARMVAATEVEEGRRLAEALIKRLTGGDRIAARYLFAEYFEFVPAFLAFLAVNHRPIVKGDDPAIWRRLIVIPFDRVVAPDKRDPRLAEKLLAERDAILAWMVRGCLKWQQEGRLSVPDSCVTAANDYRESMDSLGIWMAERCIVLAGVSVRAGHLYADYVEWARTNGHMAVSSTRFGVALVDRGFDKHKTNAGLVYRGIGLGAEK